MTRSSPLFATADFDVVVLTTDDESVGPWRQSSFAVIHRQYKVVGAVTGMFTEACLAAKMMQETLDVVVPNLHKPIAELSSIEPVKLSKGPTFN